MRRLAPAGVDDLQHGVRLGRPVLQLQGHHCAHAARWRRQGSRVGACHRRLSKPAVRRPHLQTSGPSRRQPQHTSTRPRPHRTSRMRWTAACGMAVGSLVSSRRGRAHARAAQLAVLHASDKPTCRSRATYRMDAQVQWLTCRQQWVLLNAQQDTNMPKLRKCGACMWWAGRATQSHVATSE